MGVSKTDAEYAAMTLPKRGKCAVGERDGVPVAVMTQEYFDDLLDYSYSLPTGKYIGKRWKSNSHQYFRSYSNSFPDIWYMVSYEEHDDPTMVKIVRRRIEISDPDKALLDFSRANLIE